MSGIRFGCPQAAIYRLKQTVTLTQAAPRCQARRAWLGHANTFFIARHSSLAFGHQATKQPLPLTKAFEREAARQNALFVPCCQPPCFRQGGIINIPDRLSTAGWQKLSNPCQEQSTERFSVQTLLRLAAFRQFREGFNFQQTSFVGVGFEFNLFQLPFALHSNREGLRVALPLDPQGKKPSQIRAAVRRVMLLPVLVITEDEHAVEIRRVGAVGILGAALFEDHPAPRPRIFSLLLLTARGLLPHVVAVKPLPCDELPTRAVEDDVARHRQLDLFSEDPPRRGRGCGSRQAHFVPKPVNLLRLFRLVLLPFTLGGPLLHGPGLRRVVALGALQSLRSRHTLPADDVELRAALQLHQDVVVAAAVGREPDVGAGAELARSLRGNAFVLPRELPRALDHPLRDEVARLDPTLDRLRAARADVQPALARVLDGGRAEDVQVVAADDLLEVGGDDRRRTPHLCAPRDDVAGLLFTRERAASAGDEREEQN